MVTQISEMPRIETLGDRFRNDSNLFEIFLGQSRAELDFPVVIESYIATVKGSIVARTQEQAVERV